MRITRTVSTIAAVSALALLPACSSSGKKAADTTVASSPSTTVATRPAGPAATVAGPLTGGKGIALIAAVAGPKLADAGYVEDEYSASGTATAYKSDAPLPADGTFALTPSATAPYTTRFVVRRPKDAATFNGTVVVEWLNVSAGFDTPPDYTYESSELIREGYAWVGVSAQRIGIEGGQVLVSTPISAQAGAGKGIKKLDPARYGSLHHPGDAFSYDIFTQVARSLRAPGAVKPLGGLVAKHLIADGESQSAFALTTYVDGVQPLTREFDGFLIHSRGGSAAPLGVPGKGIDLAGSIAGKATKIRTDGAAPIIVLESETDVIGLLGYFPAQQPDSARFRLWEVAGTSHADQAQVGIAGSLLGCPKPINAGPQQYVVRSALSHLNTWIDGGAAPPEASRFETTKQGGKDVYARDADGNVKGGIRTPQLDVAVDVLSGSSGGGSVACALFGTTTPIPAARLHAKFASKAAYLAAYTKATDAAVKAGFVLPADRAAMLKEAKPDRITG